jgi:hypothetical protein
MRGSLKSAHYTCPDLPLFYRCQINIKYANVKRFTPLGMPGMRMQGRFIGTIRFPFAEGVEEWHGLQTMPLTRIARFHCVYDIEIAL